MAERHIEKTCADCKCRNCDPITSMAERLDAYVSAQNLIKNIPRPEDDPISAHEVLVLANWLYYGSEDGGSD
jgi:hypothetical protein